MKKRALALGPFALVASVSGLCGQTIDVEFEGASVSAFTAEDQTLIRTIAEEAYYKVRQLLPQLTETVRLTVVAGPDVIPATGDGGAAMAPGHIRWTVDPQRPEGIAGIARAHLRAALFHELHHLVRGYVMVGGATSISLLDAVVSEGLATVFSRDFAGDSPPWGDYPENVRDWVEELVALPPSAEDDYDQWMFAHPDGRRWIGYRAGTYIADQAMAASGLSAVELVSTPTDEILHLAGIR